MALDALVEAHFLSLKPNGFYARRAEGAQGGTCMTVAR